MDSSVLIVGGGIAGLAAARRLALAGRRVTLLEARARLGGRIWTEHPRALRQSVEVGPEFVHGGDRAIQAAFRRAGMRRQRTNPEIWIPGPNGFRREHDYWTKIARVTRRIPKGTRASFAAFLRTQPNLTPSDRARFLAYVESFNAAPANRISAESIRAEKGGAESDDFRPGGGYDVLVHHYANELRRLSVAVQLNCAVTSVTWKKGEVEVRAGGRRWRAAAAIITLPLGVLQQGDVRFHPRLVAKERIIARLGWGHVARIALRFGRRFWRDALWPAELRRRGRPCFGFLNVPDIDFPTWWVPDPAEPVVVGWSGGPRSERLLRLRPNALVGRALASLATVGGHATARLRRELRGSWFHNWTRDPFVGGAYSYPVAGKEAGPTQLARPLAGTLFFAGEATAEALGTVHGAHASGLRAAEQVLGR